jgi:fumarate reductase flavoprotein subunit
LEEKMTKKNSLIGLSVFALAVFGCGGVEGEPDRYKPGGYAASSEGYHAAQNAGAPVRVRLDFSGTAITEFKVVSHSETSSREAVHTALNRIPQAVLERQSADVDGITGATFTSAALINAAKACIAQAELP